ncbi:MAG: hypothetical protein ACOCV1_01635 [Bacillota bacterium]
MKANKFLDIKNLVIGLKGLVISIFTGFILVLPAMTVRWVYDVKEMPVVAMLLGLGLLVVNYHLWGYLSNKMWGWK